ncbi:unnamed protein product, partial [Effrenium voratum]
MGADVAAHPHDAATTTLWDVERPRPRPLLRPFLTRPKLSQPSPGDDPNGAEQAATAADLLCPLCGRCFCSGCSAQGWTDSHDAALGELCAQQSVPIPTRLPAEPTARRVVGRSALSLTPPRQSHRRPSTCQCSAVSAWRRCGARLPQWQRTRDPCRRGLPRPMIWCHDARAAVGEWPPASLPYGQGERASVRR